MDENNDSETTYSQEMSHSSTSIPPPLIPQFIRDKGFDLREWIGRGEYSDVYKAVWNRMPGVEIACKRIKLAEVDKEWKDKCLNRELVIIKRLKHKNIVEVYEVFRTPRVVFIFMQWANNGSVRDFLEKHKYPMRETQAKVWFSDIMAGLSYMHSKGIAHRDLKLDNFLLNYEYSAIISDFGFAVFGESNQKLMCETMCGSPVYMAPEVHYATKHALYDPKIADLYSMGICLFEMINYDKPFEQSVDTNSLAQLIRMKMDRNFRYHSKIDTQLSSDIKDLIYKLLDPNPQKRISMKHILKHRALQ